MYKIEKNKRIEIILFDSLKKDLQVLEFCIITHKYNLHMGGSDGNT